MQIQSNKCNKNKDTYMMNLYTVFTTLKAGSHLYAFTHSVLVATQGSYYYYPVFLNEESKAQRSFS